MKKTVAIAKLELSMLFYSPVAWLVLIIFIIQSGTRFLGMFGGYQEAMAMGNRVNDLTFAMFPGTNGLFDQTLQNIYLYIPLLTMGLLSRELSSGSIKLLLSSPVKVASIIFGKYLAIIAYGFLLITVLSAYALVGMVVIKDADTGLIFSGLIGLFLLICTYAAIGLFMSSLTAYQVVAAISTIAVFAVLQYVGSVGQELNFIRDLTYFLSISGRTDDLLKGLINSRDVLYFLIIIALFLSLNILRLSASRSAKHWSIKYRDYSAVVLCALLAVYVTSRPRFIGYLDLTATKSQTLTPNSQDIAKQIKGKLTITTYVNLLDQNVYTGLPAARNLDLSRFDQYRRYIPDLDMKYVFYYDITDLKNNSNMIYQGDLTGLTVKQVAVKVAENMGLNINDFMPPMEIRKRINLRDEDNTLVRILDYKGKTSKLRLYDEMDAFPSETEISAAIKRLVVPAPKIVFITGHNERSVVRTGDRNYQMVTNNRKARKSLINQGFEVQELDLSRSEIPDSTTVLVLADPSMPLNPDEQSKVELYLKKGGNMMITTEPGRQQVINPVFTSLGIKLENGQLVAPSKDNSPDLIMAYPLHDSIGVGMTSAAALNVNDTTRFKVDTLLMSDTKGWNEQGKIDLSSSKLVFDRSSGKQGGFPVALSLTRSVGGKLQQIFVSGDADFLDNAALKQPKGMNNQFSIKIFKWFSDGEFPIDTRRPVPTDDDILINKRAIATLKLLFLGVTPGIIALLGAYLLISRKRK